MYEGEVMELTPEETENQLGGYGKVISHVIISLRTVKGTKQLKLDPTIFDSMQKEKIQASLMAAHLFCPLLRRSHLHSLQGLLFRASA